MKVIGTKTGGYAIFGSATSGAADSQVDVYGAYYIGTITNRVSYGASDTCNNLCDTYINVTIGGRKSPVRFVGSKPSWWADANSWRQAKQLVWNEMENGALVLKTPISSGDLNSTIYSKYGNDYEVPSDTLTIGGKSYTVNIMELGYLSSAGDTSMTKNNEFVKYVYGSRNSASEGGVAPGWGSFLSGGLVQLAQDGKYNNAYAVPYYTSATASTPTGTYAKSDGAIRGKRYMSIMFVAHPASYKPYIEGLPANLGEHSRGFNVVSRVTYDGSGTIDWEITKGETVVATGNDVSASSPITISTEELNELGVGTHQLTVEVSGAGGSNSYTTSVTVTKNTIDVQGKAVSVDARPIACSLVNIVQLGTGATQKWYVTNNANDEAPIWEEYGGGIHEFSNDTKQGDSWAVAWRCQIGGPDSTSQSKLSQKVGMAVVYDAGD